jgi:hypothetical protein
VLILPYNTPPYIGRVADREGLFKTHLLYFFLSSPPPLTHPPLISPTATFLLQYSGLARRVRYKLYNSSIFGNFIMKLTHSLGLLALTTEVFAFAAPDDSSMPANSAGRPNAICKNVCDVYFQMCIKVVCLLTQPLLLLT